MSLAACGGDSSDPSAPPPGSVTPQGIVCSQTDGVTNPLQDQLIGPLLGGMKDKPGSQVTSPLIRALSSILQSVNAMSGGLQSLQDSTGQPAQNAAGLQQALGPAPDQVPAALVCALRNVVQSVDNLPTILGPLGTAQLQIPLDAVSEQANGLIALLEDPTNLLDPQKLAGLTQGLGDLVQQLSVLSGQLPQGEGTAQFNQLVLLVSHAFGSVLSSLTGLANLDAPVVTGNLLQVVQRIGTDLPGVLHLPPKAANALTQLVTGVVGGLQKIVDKLNPALSGLLQTLLGPLLSGPGGAGT